MSDPSPSRSEDLADGTSVMELDPSVDPAMQPVVQLVPMDLPQDENMHHIVSSVDPQEAQAAPLVTPHADEEEPKPKTPKITQPTTANINAVEAETLKPRERPALLKSLECCVCFEVPHGKIEMCVNGHICCPQCQSKLIRKVCPVCQTGVLKQRNLFAEDYLATLANDDSLEFSCHFKPAGCKFTGSLANVKKHELMCTSMTVPCPGYLRGACCWTGELFQYVKHFTEKKCLQVVKCRRQENNEIYDVRDPQQQVPEPKVWCSSIVGETIQGPGPNTGMSIFESIGPSHWKPTVLVDPSNIRLFPTLVIYRGINGVWNLTVRTHLAKEIRDHFRAIIKITRPTESLGHNKDPMDFDGVAFVGDLQHVEATDEEILRSCQYLRLSDPQVKLLREGPELFRYFIRIVRISEGSPRPSCALANCQ